jgi:hypothetical protein
MTLTTDLRALALTIDRCAAGLLALALCLAWTGCADDDGTDDHAGAASAAPNVLTDAQLAEDTAPTDLTAPQAWVGPLSASSVVRLQGSARSFEGEFGLPRRRLLRHGLQYQGGSPRRLLLRPQ